MLKMMRKTSIKNIIKRPRKPGGGALRACRQGGTFRFLLLNSGPSHVTYDIKLETAGKTLLGHVRLDPAWPQTNGLLRVLPP